MPPAARISGTPGSGVRMAGQFRASPLTLAGRLGDEERVRREDARFVELATPRVVAAALVVLALPLTAWAVLVGAWLGVAVALVFAVVGWAGVRLAGEVQVREAELAQLRSTDGLTGLPNRRVWEDALPRELSRAIRTGSPL